MAEMDGKKDDDKARVLWTEFLEGTTLHGAQHTVGSHNIIRRAVWVFIIIGLTIGFCAFVAQSLSRYYDHPTATKVILHRPDAMEFPAVTICNANSVRKSYIKDIPLLSKALMDNSLTSDRHDYLNYSDPMVLAELSRYKMADVYMNAKHQTDEMFLLCKWQSMYIPCDVIITPSNVMGAHCYTINSRERIEDNGPSVTTRMGEFGGFNVMLDIQTEEYTVESGSASGCGVYVMVHDPQEYPDMSRMLKVPPGVSAYVAITKFMTKGLQPPYQDSSCSGPNEKEPVMNTDHTYSYALCRTQCLNDYVYAMCNCSIYGGVRPGCNMAEYIDCVGPHLGLFFINSSIGEACSCHHPCEKTDYLSTISHMSYPGEYLREQIDRSILTFDYVKENILELKVFFETFTHQEIVQYPSYTLTDFASDLGGQLGLFLGASIMTGVEILDLLFRLVAYAFRPRRPKTPDNKVDAATPDGSITKPVAGMDNCNYMTTVHS